jgi:hypothetical protein
MSPAPRPEAGDPVGPADREQHPDPRNPLEDPMDTDPQLSTRPDGDPADPGDPGDQTRVFETTTATDDAPTLPATTQRTPRAPRVGTVVWGLVIAAIGVGILALAAGLVFDVELALIALVAAAGAALLVGSLITGVRRSGRR